MVEIVFGGGDGEASGVLAYLTIKNSTVSTSRSNRTSALGRRRSDYLMMKTSVTTSRSNITLFLFLFFFFFFVPYPQ